MNKLITLIKQSPKLALVLVVSCMYLLTSALIHSPNFISPLSNERVSLLSVVREKVEQKTNTYSVKNPVSFAPPSYAGADYDNASSYAVIDYDTGEIISEKDLSKKVPIASLTKIMTAITALDLASPDDVFTANEHDSEVIPTKIAVEPGEKFTLRELLNASLLTSANDATELIKDGVNAKYGGDVFINAMNMKAKFIGLKNSHFVNPQGFDNKDHYSTAEDLAVLTHYALTNYPLIREIVKKDQEVLQANQNHRHFVLYNWNGLIGVYPDVYGMKIGNTDDAGMTTAVVSDRGGKKLIAIVLGAPGVLQRDLWASQLLDTGYEKLLGLPPIAVTENQLRAKYATWVPWS